MGGGLPFTLSSKTVLQHMEYCTLEQWAGGMDVKELHAYSKRELDEISTDKKEMSSRTNKTRNKNKQDQSP